MSSLVDVLLLFALPASGKSEVRRYLASLRPEQCRGCRVTARNHETPAIV